MTNNLIIVSACQDRLAFWKQALNSFASTIFEIDNPGKLKNDVARIKPGVLLLDYESLGSDDISGLRSICTETKVVVVGRDISEEIEWELLKAGVRGCCQYEVQAAFLKQVVVAVQDGELWIRRTLISRLIDQLGKTTAKYRAYPNPVGKLDRLTQREFDIAVRVENGDSNKQIAKLCSITERTVKAHLTEIFIKLGVAGRLNLALVMSADDRRNGLRYRTPEVHRTAVSQNSAMPRKLELARAAWQDTPV